MIEFLTENLFTLLGSAGGFGVLGVIMSLIRGRAMKNEDTLTNITRNINPKNILAMVIVLLLILIGVLLYLYVDCSQRLGLQKTQIVVGTNTNNKEAMLKLKKYRFKLSSIESLNDSLRHHYYKQLIILASDTTSIDTARGDIW